MANKNDLILARMKLATVVAEFEMYGMIADNTTNAIRGQPPVYKGSDFYISQDRYERKMNDLIDQVDKTNEE